MDKVAKINRFRKIHTESVGFGENVLIIQDMKTGVEYMYVQSGYSGGLTPLLDREGKPVVSSTLNIED